jgi:hypothetical protein
VSTKDLDAESIIAAFNHHSVQLHGAPVPPTEDIDFTPATSEDNLERLDRSLTALRARIRSSEEPDGLAFEHNAKTLGERRMLNLTCRHGDFDISFVPSGTEGYGDLVRRALPVRIGAATVYVAALVDIIRSKRAAGRPKDFRTLPILVRYASGKGVDVPEGTDVSPHPDRPNRPAVERPTSVDDARTRLARAKRAKPTESAPATEPEDPPPTPDR